MKIIGITQARYGSSRLPGKVLKEINGKSLLEMHLQRARLSAKMDDLIIATTMEIEADKIVEIASMLGFKCFRGSTENVLDRYYQAAKNESPDYIIRITSDCPLIDPQIIDNVIDECIKGKYDYCSNIFMRTYPDGMDVEVMTFSALEKTWKEAKLAFELEHVTPYIIRNSNYHKANVFKTFNVTSDFNYSDYRFTVDTFADFVIIEKLISAIGDDKSWLEYVKYLNKHPELYS